jgi:ribosomal-protein-alanine N-acetyltransferase
LLSALLQQARQQGAIHATLEVGSNNLAAIALYANGGFQSAGTRLKYYSDGSDALIQWCRINASSSQISIIFVVRFPVFDSQRNRPFFRVG